MSVPQASGGELAGRDGDKAAQAAAGGSGQACAHPEGYEGECPCPSSCICCPVQAAASPLRERIEDALRGTARADCHDWPPRTPHGDGHNYDMRCALCSGDIDALTNAVLAAIDPHANQPASGLHRYRAWLANEHAQAVTRDQSTSVPDELRISPHNGIAAGLAGALHGVDHLLGAHDGGPTVREAADNDRRWPLEKAGE